MKKFIITFFSILLIGLTSIGGGLLLSACDNSSYSENTGGGFDDSENEENTDNEQNENLENSEDKVEEHATTSMAFQIVFITSTEAQDEYREVWDEDGQNPSGDCPDLIIKDLTDLVDGYIDYDTPDSVTGTVRRNWEVSGNQLVFTNPFDMSKYTMLTNVTSTPSDKGTVYIYLPSYRYWLPEDYNITGFAGVYTYSSWLNDDGSGYESLTRRPAVNRYVTGTSTPNRLYFNPVPSSYKTYYLVYYGYKAYYENNWYYRNTSNVATSYTTTYNYLTDYTTPAVNSLQYYSSYDWEMDSWVYNSNRATNDVYDDQFGAGFLVNLPNYQRSNNNWYAVSTRQVSIRYNANQGSYSGPTTASSTQYFNQYYGNVSSCYFSITTTQPTRSGYEFLGWSQNSNSQVAEISPGSRYDFTPAYNQSSYINLYAVWGLPSLRLTYNTNGGSSIPADNIRVGDTYGKTNLYKPQASQNDSITLSNNVYTVNSTNSGTDMKWMNFFQSFDGTYSSNTTYSVVINVTQFSYDAFHLVFTSTYDEGSNPGDIGNGQLTFAINGLGTYLYQFTTRQTIGKPTYNFRSYIPQGTGTRIYCKFTVSVFTGNIYYEEGEFTYATPGNMPSCNTLPIPTKEGYVFEGWYLDLAFTNRVTASTIVTKSTSHLLYARWIPNEYTNRYHYRNTAGTETIYSDQIRTYGKSFTTLSTSSIPEYVSNGWRLYAWAISSSSTSGTYSPNTSITSTTYTQSTSILDWYAISQRRITINYNANGGSNTPSATSSIQQWNQYGNRYNISSLSVTSSEPTRTGYTFLGWSTSSSATTPTYEARDTISFTYNSSNGRTLYAVWEANVYTITLNKQSGSGGLDKIYLKYNTGWYSNSSATTSISTITPPTRAGFTFQGYYTGTNGSGTQVINSSGQIISGRTTITTSNISLYAKWEAKNPAYYDEEQGLWYIEMGKYPQTRLGDESVISELDILRESGAVTEFTYIIGNYTLNSYIYNEKEYAYLEESNAYYLVEPVKYYLAGDYEEGYGIENGNVTAVTEQIVFVSEWSNTKLSLGDGYTSSTIRTNLNTFVGNSQINSDYLNTNSYTIKNFKDVNGVSTDTTLSADMIVSNESEVETVFGDLSAEFSDLVSDILGNNLMYWTRDVGSNLNTAEYVTRFGSPSQARMQKMLGVRITINVKTFGCL